MAQLVGADEIEALHTELSDIGRSLRTPFRLHNSSSVKDAFDEDLIQQWAKIERLPTYERSRAFLFDEHNDENEDVKGKRVTDVRELGALDRHLFVERLIRQIEADNLHLLQKLRNRIDKAGIKLPAIEVKYQNLCVEAKCSVVDGKPLPTLWNSLKGKLSVFTKVVGSKLQEARISIVQNVSGIIKPGRLTLLLGPPGCGKTSLLLALSGNMKKSLKVSGEITYNGYKLNELVPQKNSVYVSQYDVHIPEITVRETADFSARCQGVGSRAEIMIELCRREKQAGIIPEPDIDAYMKAISTEGLKNTLQTDYILKILGLDVCSDTIVGDAMRRGISGGQKKRLTTGEMIVGPTKALLLDEITNGLDSSTAYQIVAYIQQLVHITDTTALVALLQPAPEIFHLFDDVIMMAEGKIIYHGPRSSVLGFFEECGFRCPHRKGVADFLQEFISRKDQQQYWFLDDQPYSYFSVDMFCEKFTASNVGRRLYGEVSQQYFKSESDEKAISFNVYSLSKWELLKACMSREYLLIKRNSFVYLFKIIQLVIVAFMSMTLFLRTRLGVINVNYYMGALFYTLNILLVDGFPEAGLTVIRLPVFFKQRDMYFYPAWACTIPSSILRIPLSVLASFVWTSITYYVIGYSPEFGRFFRQFLLLSAVHFTSLSFFRFFAALFQTMVAVMSAGSSFLLFVFIFSGFVIPQSSMPAWLKWGFLVSPLSYGEIGVSVNEFLAPRWKKMTLSNATIGSIGRQALDLHGLDFADYYYWISYWALVGFAILANIGYTLALTFLKAPGTPAAIISREKLAQLQGVFHPRSGAQVSEKITSHVETKLVPGKGRMVLPFQPLTIAFRNMNYYVDTPMVSLLVIADFPVSLSVWLVFRDTEELVKQLSSPPSGSEDLHFRTRYSQNGWEQFKSCLWKLHLSYWRSPSYNLMRLLHTLLSSLVFGLLFWKQGRDIRNQQSLFTVLGSMFAAVMFLGINNCSNVLPFVATERAVVCRERFAGMYSPWAYSFAQVVVEVPYLLSQAVMFTIITYPMIGYYSSAYKVFWYCYGIFSTLMYFNYMGMMLVSLTPNYQVAGIISSPFYSMFSLFAGFYIPAPHIPKWWIWLYYLCPTSWTLKGMLTSQYGDVQTETTMFDQTNTVTGFLKEYFGFDRDQLGLVAVILIAYPLVFASLFGFFMGRLNFQRR